MVYMRLVSVTLHRRGSRLEAANPTNRHQRQCGRRVEVTGLPAAAPLVCPSLTPILSQLSTCQYGLRGMKFQAVAKRQHTPLDVTALNP
ncbi:uncharacterized protein PgNI_07481 [Pyricularia grisea]|uniref:Uncharacterized protein n=1 Tax=Pyricularia grisea TaxID=148305 RepID=A0A6P8B0H0_PYRGI|nr:uncharacterized protein PgNI_07481 [Pyricularia grisea]TLD08321.1 hypothetical protein PgNI_07481 [Pyricularia grisea]